MSETVVVSAGNFWELEDFISKIPGVIQTTAGYAGGTSDEPVYHRKNDHLEVVRIEFDPRILDEETLISKFLQYANQHGLTDDAAIFYFDQNQPGRWRKIHRQASEEGLKLQDTKLLPINRFYEAEPYNQKYLARLRGEATV